MTLESLLLQYKDLSVKKCTERVCLKNRNSDDMVSARRLGKDPKHIYNTWAEIMV